MDAGTAFGGMEADAGLGVGVVGDFGAAVGVQSGVGFAGGDDRDAAGSQKRTEADAEGESEVLFGLAAGETSAGVVAAVSGVKHHHEAGGGAQAGPCAGARVAAAARRASAQKGRRRRRGELVQRIDGQAAEELGEEVGGLLGHDVAGKGLLPGAAPW